MILLPSTWLHVDVVPVQGCLGLQLSQAGHSEYQGVIRILQHGAETGGSMLRGPIALKQAQPSFCGGRRWPGIKRRYPHHGFAGLADYNALPFCRLIHELRSKGFANRWILQLKPELFSELDPHRQ